MSKKRMMSKQQRLYYEYNNRERVREELAEMAKKEKELEKDYSYKIYNRHETFT